MCLEPHRQDVHTFMKTDSDEELDNPEPADGAKIPKKRKPRAKPKAKVADGEKPPKRRKKKAKKDGKSDSSEDRLAFGKP